MPATVIAAMSPVAANSTVARRPGGFVGTLTFDGKCGRLSRRCAEHPGSAQRVAQPPVASEPRLRWPMTDSMSDDEKRHDS